LKTGASREKAMLFLLKKNSLFVLHNFDNSAHFTHNISSNVLKYFNIIAKSLSQFLEDFKSTLFRALHPYPS